MSQDGTNQDGMSPSGRGGEDPYARDNEKARKRKEARDKMLAEKTIEKGLTIVHTGKGKGKSTAAFGLVFRAIGNGMRVGVIQFVKGKWETGERFALEKFPDQVEIYRMGEGFSWETQNRGRDIQAARAAWDKAKEMIEACRSEPPPFDMLLLDELNIPLRYDNLPIDEVVETLNQAARPARHRHRPQRQGPADRGGRPGDRHDHGQTPLPRRREGAEGDRVLRWLHCGTRACFDTPVRRAAQHDVCYKDLKSIRRHPEQAARAAVSKDARRLSRPPTRIPSSTGRRG